MNQPIHTIRYVGNPYLSHSLYPIGWSAKVDERFKEVKEQPKTPTKFGETINL